MFLFTFAIKIRYEEFRSTHDPARKLQVFQESVARADAIPVPTNVLALPQLKTQAMPIEATVSDMYPIYIYLF